MEIYIVNQPYAGEVFYVGTDKELATKIALREANDSESTVTLQIWVDGVLVETF